MQTNLRGRDLIGDLDFSKEEVETVLDVAWDLKRKRALGEPHAYLRDKVLAMLFFFSSTRTRASFEAGMPRKSGRFLAVTLTASPSVSATGNLATPTSTRSPCIHACRSSTCSAMSITPSSAWLT